jgi:hypothetical protein
VAEIVLVHGIGQEQLSADSLEAKWLPALAGGLRLARHPAIADSIWREARHGVVGTRMAYYGDLFRESGAQGSDLDLGEGEQFALAEDVAAEWLEHAAARSESAEDRLEAHLELERLRGERGARQGARATLRPALQVLARQRWFATHGMAFAERFIVRSLRQTTRYLTEDDLRTEAKARVRAQISESTKAVLSHSLGSVVAFEALQDLDQQLPLFLTMGSPLGLDTIVYSRLRPYPPSFPTQVQRWVNVADRDDLVAADLDLSTRFGPTIGTKIESCIVDNGSKPHDATHYLVKASVGAPVGETLAAHGIG